jgi:hypothetical protein
MKMPARHGGALRGSLTVVAAPAEGRAPFASSAPEGRAPSALSAAAKAHRRLLAVAAVFAVCTAGLWVLHRESEPRYRLSAAAAVAAAKADEGDREFLSRHATDEARVIPLDATVQRVTFFDGPRVVLDAAVGQHGEVVASEEHTPGVPASGAAIANSPWVLTVLSAVFLLAVAVVPLRSVRNLDAAALASLSITVGLINARLVAASVLCAEAALLYLTARCLCVGFGPGGARADRTAPGQRPLTDRLWAGWEPRRRTKMLRLITAATVLAFLLITLTSSGYTDVAAASLQGATDLLHGVLPYGRITLAFHGDTYPLLNYVAYVPAAVWLPVSNGFSDLSGSLWTTAAASLLTGAALWRIAGRPEFGGGSEAGSDGRLRAVLAWFAFPPVLLAASGGANDIVLAACLAWMLALRTRTAASLAALAAGVWVKLVPITLAPIWIPYRRRGLRRSLSPALALSAAVAALMLALGGTGAAAATAHALSFQFQRGSFYAPWYTFGVQWLQPAVQAAVLAILAAAVLRLRAEETLRTDLVRLSAIGAALLLGVQLAANYWTWSYLPWLFPFIAAALFMSDERRGAASRTPGPS